MLNDGNLFNLFLEQQDKYQKSLIEQEKTLNEKNKTIELAVKKIKQEIRQEYKEQEDYNKIQVRDNRKLLNRYASYIEMYSTFNARLIGNILAYLVKVFDDIDLVYESGDHAYNVNTVFWDTLYERETYKILKMLVKEEYLNSTHKYTDYEGEDYIEHLASTSNAIIIEDATPISRNGLNRSEIMFYSIKDGKICFTSSFENYSYLKDFINLVISYRFLNQKKVITEKELMRLLNNYISANYDIINQKHHNELKRKIHN